MSDSVKYIAVATRRNVDGKPDYRWVKRYTNGLPVLFESYEAALDRAKSACDDPCYAMYDPRAEIFTEAA